MSFSLQGMQTLVQLSLYAYASRLFPSLLSDLIPKQKYDNSVEDYNLFIIIIKALLWKEVQKI